MSKLKSKSVLECADIFMSALLVAKSKSEITPFIDDIFLSKGIYFDQNSTNNVLDILLEKGYIEAIPNSASLRTFPKTVAESKLLDKSPAEALKQIDFTVQQYQLSVNGFRFVSSGQKLFTPNYLVLFDQLWQSNKVAVVIYVLLTIVFSVIGFVATLLTLLGK